MVTQVSSSSLDALYALDAYPLCYSMRTRGVRKGCVQGVRAGGACRGQTGSDNEAAALVRYHSINHVHLVLFLLHVEPQRHAHQEILRCVLRGADCGLADHCGLAVHAIGHHRRITAREWGK